jgi:cobalamin biosynthesis Mg chelatase CobN
MCGEAVSTPSPDKSTSQLTSTTSSTRHTTNHNRNTKSTIKTPNPTSVETIPSTPKSNRNNSVDENASTSERSSSESWDNFTYGVLVGCGATLLVVISVVLVYFFLCRKAKNEKTKSNYSKLFY